MIRGPRYKIARRLGERIYPKTQTAKFALSLARRGAPAKKRRGGMGKSEYGSQLLEKQRVRMSYGISERQFSKEVKRARSAANAALHLYQRLEKRLDNVLYRIGLAASRAAARQMVSHGHITVNGARVKIPSAEVRVGDAIAVRAGSRAAGPFRDLAERMKGLQIPPWLSFDPAAFEGAIRGEPLLDASQEGFNLQSILEFYR